MGWVGHVRGLLIQRRKCHWLLELDILTACRYCRRRSSSSLASAYFRLSLSLNPSVAPEGNATYSHGAFCGSLSLNLAAGDVCPENTTAGYQDDPATLAMATESQHSRAYRAVPGFLRTLREEAGLTQRELGKRLKRPQSWVHNCETANRRVDVTEFIAWAQACAVEPKGRSSGSCVFRRGNSEQWAGIRRLQRSGGLKPVGANIRQPRLRLRSTPIPPAIVQMLRYRLRPGARD